MSNSHFLLAVRDEASVSEEVYTTTGESSGEESVAASLGLNPQLFVFQLMNFTLVALIVWYLILKPLTKKMDDRKRFIDESLMKAKQADTDLKMSTAKAQQVIDEAKVAANKIIEHAQSDAVDASEKVKQKAKEEIELLVQQAKRNIDIDKEQMRTELRRETATLVIAVTEKLLGRVMDDKKDAEFIEDMIKNMK